jgi:hypothetical protein
LVLVAAPLFTPTNGDSQRKLKRERRRRRILSSLSAPPPAAAAAALKMTKADVMAADIEWESERLRLKAGNIFDTRCGWDTVIV